MKRLIQEVFDFLGITKYKENIGVLTSHVETILSPIPLGEMGHSTSHYAEHIKLCLPENVLKYGKKSIAHHLNIICNSSDLRIIMEKAAQNMKKQREAIKTMLREVGINKEEIGNDAWKDNIRHVVDLFGAMKPEEFKPLIQTLTASAMDKKEQHKDVKSLFSSIIEEYRQQTE